MTYPKALGRLGWPTSWTALSLMIAAVAAVGLLYAPWIAEPSIRYDDFNFLTKSRTWDDTAANLLVPTNEHVMPLARLAAGALMGVVSRQSSIPRAAEIHGVLAVVAGMWLIYGFVSREAGHEFYAILAMTLWGVTSSYYECVTWYSASFFILALDMLLCALLAAQAYARTGKSLALVACGVACVLAPAFHSTALPSGLWCTLYLMFGGPGDHGGHSSWRRQIAAAVVPLLGTVTYALFGVLVSSGQILHATHYRGKTIFEAFNPLQGVLNSIRTFADNQLPGAIGIWNKQWTLPWASALIVVAGAGVLGYVWWRVARQRRLLVLGLAVIVASDVLVYGARADWSYERSVHNWTRYHVFPHLGLVLFVLGGLPAFDGRWFSLVPGRLSRRQTLALAGVIIVMLCCHWPRTHQQHFNVPAEQHAVLLHVERVDAHCRVGRIDGATARAALPFLQFPLGYKGDNAWEFLRGSPSPVPMPVEQARVWLTSVH